MGLSRLISALGPQITHGPLLHLIQGFPHSSRAPDKPGILWHKKAILKGMGKPTHFSYPLGERAKYRQEQCYLSASSGPQGTPNSFQDSLRRLGVSTKWPSGSQGHGTKMLLSGNRQVKLGRQRLREKIPWEVGTEKSGGVEGRERVQLPSTRQVQVGLQLSLSLTDSNSHSSWAAGTTAGSTCGEAS